MTMRLTIENADSLRTATVCEETFTIGEGPLPTSRNIVVLGPGAKQSFYIHAAKRLLVSEDPDAQIAPPPAETDPAEEFRRKSPGYCRDEWHNKPCTLDDDGYAQGASGSSVAP